tara:strand:- start:11 stop:190 length:180 start_codon:yes stop_codon:yes gene_type:complete
MSNNIYKIIFDIEREAFLPMTDNQWEMVKQALEGESFDNAWASCIGIAREIETNIVGNK